MCCETVLQGSRSFPVNVQFVTGIRLHDVLAETPEEDQLSPLTSNYFYLPATR